MAMTPEAKELLSRTIRGLHDVLIPDLVRETERVYQRGLAAKDARLDEATARRRARLEAFLAEQVRSGKRSRNADEHLRDVVKQASSTLVNRLVVLRLLEAGSRHRNPVLSGGQTSQAYLDFVAFAPPLADDPQHDDSRGYAFLLALVFEELSVDLPGLFGPAGIADLIVVPWPTLHHAIKAMGQPGLESCWTDDMTLGWVYQYWNDPDREALDAKLHRRERIENHEIASKTQMFTERYMVDWLLQNSLVPLWLAICKKRGWIPTALADGTLANLETRRTAWRDKRERGEVSLTALMPHSDAEHRWVYYVPQPLPADAPDHAPASIRDVKILDPAVGSGHFLVIAFELLVALYREEARHCGEAGQARWSDRAIAESILENNLYGIDIDPRAVQIAAAALWLKARELCPEAHPRHLNLVASNLRLASLPKDDPALAELRATIADETGIPSALTDTIVKGLTGADHLGSLLRVDDAVERAIETHEFPAPKKDGTSAQIDLSATFMEVKKEDILKSLENFLDKHTSGDDLGLRLRGEQLATGVRFLRMIRGNSYDLVVGNPPYQGTSKLMSPGAFRNAYPNGKADLFAAFLERGLQLARPGGTSALLTMRNWMFIKQFARLRAWLLQNYDLRALGDFAIGAFAEVANDVLSVCVSVFRKVPPSPTNSVALQPTPPDDRSYDRERTPRKRAAVLVQVGRMEFQPQDLAVIPEWPLVYWWTRAFLDKYQGATKLVDVAPAKFGLTTGDNSRFVRSWQEVLISPQEYKSADVRSRWVPFVLGAKGLKWFEPLQDVLFWRGSGLELRIFEGISPGAALRNQGVYFKRGVAFSMIGADFSARFHRYPGIISNKGSSVFPQKISEALAMMNSGLSQSIMGGLNPGIGFEVGDVNRLPLFPIASADEIFATIERAFTEHEAHREPSVEFRRPGPSPWRHAQAWAQAAVDRPEGAPLPPYLPDYDPEPATDPLSFALGVALGRLGADGQGILDPTTADLSRTLPHGICFLDTTLGPSDLRDSLGHPAARPLIDVWDERGPEIAGGSDLRGYLAHKFFDLHRKMYDSRPIHWPLSSEKRTFVAWITIHRWDAETLRCLLADHLYPARGRLEGELPDLRAACDSKDKKAVRSAQKRLEVVQKAQAELSTFITAVEQCAEKGPPPPGVGQHRPEREVDTRYAPDLDDGVRVNSAALWPLLLPQWKDPKKWWHEIAAGEGKQECDWSHLAMRYWPRQVDAKCQTDRSLAVAHGCFWRHHPAHAWTWELRLQDEVAPDFRIEEEPYRGDGGHQAHRTVFLAEHGPLALQIVEKEVYRRFKKHGCLQPHIRLLEAGLWTSHTRACVALELRVLKRYRRILRKQRKAGLPTESLPAFRLIAPDEPDVQRMRVVTCPEDLARRRQLLEADLDLEIEDDEDADGAEYVEDDEDDDTADEDQDEDSDEEDDDA